MSREKEIENELEGLSHEELKNILTNILLYDDNEYEDYERDEDNKMEERLPKQEFNLLTPVEIKSKLDETVIGQDDSKIKIATEVFRHYLRLQNEKKLKKSGKKISKNNILLTGLTGTGKTFLMQEIAKILDVPIHIQDSTTLTSAGYVGDDIETCLKGLIQNADYDIEKAERGIVVLDEFDKLSRKGENPSITRDVSGESVQQGILKMLEGNIIRVPAGQRKHPREDCMEIDTTNILFVGCGSFEGIEEIVKGRMKKKNNKSSMGFGANIQSKSEEISLKEIRNSITRDDLKKYGMLPEVLGRFSILSNLHPLEKSDLVNILKNQNGLFEEYKTVFSLMGKKLIIKDEVYEFIAETALSENIGARGLRSIVEDLMYKLMFEMPSETKKTYTIDKKYCESIKICVA
jgi:ATP-dependent Clp protease ATP-binding subunit ClpX